VKYPEDLYETYVRNLSILNCTESGSCLYSAAVPLSSKGNSVVVLKFKNILLLCDLQNFFNLNILPVYSLFPEVLFLVFSPRLASYVPSQQLPTLLPLLHAVLSLYGEATSLQVLHFLMSVSYYYLLLLLLFYSDFIL
jgi:hypothetical protein